jgi:hypothetical protein
MGQLFSSLFSKLWGSKEVRILILGLDGTFLAHFVEKSIIETTQQW